MLKRHHLIDIYTQNGSRHCELTKEYFRNNNLDFQEYDVKRDKNAAERMEQLSNQKEVPVVDFDGRIIIGFRPDVYDILVGNKKE